MPANVKGDANSCLCPAQGNTTETCFLELWITGSTECNDLYLLLKGYVCNTLKGSVGLITVLVFGGMRKKRCQAKWEKELCSHLHRAGGSVEILFHSRGRLCIFCIFYTLCNLGSLLFHMSLLPSPFTYLYTSSPQSNYYLIWIFIELSQLKSNNKGMYKQLLSTGCFLSSVRY